MTERVPTGITGLDGMLEGGFLRSRTILLSGGCGTGKSIFGLQFLVNGIAAGEPGVYVTVDEPPALAREDMLRFGWDLKSLEDSGKLAILDLTGSRIGVASDERYQMNSEGIDLDRFILKMTQTASEIGAKRLVVDSLPALGFHMTDDSQIRNAILRLSFMIRQSGLTAILITETAEQKLGGGQEFSKYGVEEYVSDGVITMHYVPMGNETGRTLHIRKMRGTKHEEDSVPLNITPQGLVVTSPKDAFTV